MVVPFFPFKYCLGGQIFLQDIFLTLSHTCFMGVSADSFETYSAHDLRFFWLKSRRARACDFLKADRLSPLNSRLCRTLLSRARLAFRASRHSSSKQGFDFLGMVVALGMLSFAALVMCSTKDCKGSPSSRMSSVILSKHSVCWVGFPGGWGSVLPVMKVHSGPAQTTWAPIQYKYVVLPV